MFAALSFFPVEIRSNIATFIGIAELIRLTGPTDSSDELEIFGYYPNKVLELARSGAKMYPVLDSLGFIRQTCTNPMENIAVTCVYWAVIDEVIDREDHEYVKRSIKMYCNNFSFSKDMFNDKRYWITNGSWSVGLERVRKNIVKKWGSRLNTHQIDMILFGLYIANRPNDVYPQFIRLDFPSYRLTQRCQIPGLEGFNGC